MKPSTAHMRAVCLLGSLACVSAFAGPFAFAQPLWTPVAGKSAADCAVDRSASLVPESCVLVSFDAANRLVDAGVGTGFDADASGRSYRVDRVVRRGPRDFSVFGTLDSDPLRRFQFTLGPGGAVAWLQDVRGTWEVRPGPDGLHAMYRVEDQSTRIVDFVPGHDTAIPVPWSQDPSSPDASDYDPAPSGVSAGSAGLGSQPAAYEITLLVAYTSVVKTQLGANGLATRVQALQDWLNQALVNGGHPEITVRVLGTFETVYTQAASMTTDVERLLNPVDGYLDDLLTQRITAGADLLHLLVPDQTDACGIAYMPHDLRPDLGIGLSAVGCPVSTFAHEIGHNFGMGHDTYVSTTDNWWSWAYGYIDPDFRFRTIMAYANRCFDANRSCIGIQYFSDPDRSYQGFPTGIPYADGVRTADNVRVLEDMAGNVADNSRYLHPTCDWTARSISVTNSISYSTNASFRATLEASAAGCPLERVRLELAVGSGSNATTYPVATHEITATAGQQVQVTANFTIDSAGLVAGSYQPRVLIVRRGYYWYINNINVTSSVGVELPADLPESLVPGSPWPNPASGTLSVRLPPDAARQDVGVYDVLGRRVLRFVVEPGGRDVTFDISSLGPGAYFLKLPGGHPSRPFAVVR